MSTAVLEPIVKQPVVEQPVVAQPATSVPEVPEKAFSDSYPLLPVFVAGAAALMGSLMFVGSIVAVLLLRNSGIMAQ